MSPPDVWDMQQARKHINCNQDLTKPNTVFEGGGNQLASNDPRHDRKPILTFSAYLEIYPDMHSNINSDNVLTCNLTFIPTCILRYIPTFVLTFWHMF